MDDDPFIFMLTTAREINTPSAQYIDRVLRSTTASYIDSDLMTMKDEVKKSTGSKFMTYIQINAELEKHLLYENILIPEFKRVEVTRFRTSSHRLKIETGRWSRIARERRLCDCGQEMIQDEIHVIESCRHLSDLRLLFPDIVFTTEQFFSSNIEDVATYVFKALNILY